MLLSYNNCSTASNYQMQGRKQTSKLPYSQANSLPVPPAVYEGVLRSPSCGFLHLLSVCDPEPSTLPAPNSQCPAWCAFLTVYSTSYMRAQRRPQTRPSVVAATCPTTDVAQILYLILRSPGTHQC